MEEDNKNKPLSANQIFDLINIKLEGNKIEQDLDAFEADALEGYNSFSTFENAKNMNAEIDLAISQKISGNSDSAKNKMIWFAAAASISLIIFISVFYFKNTEINTELALAESQKKDVKFEENTISNKDLTVQQDLNATISEENLVLKEVQYSKKNKLFDSKIENIKEDSKNLILKDEGKKNNLKKENLPTKDAEVFDETQSAAMVDAEIIAKNDDVNKKNISENSEGDANLKAIDSPKPTLNKEEEFYRQSKKKPETSAPSAKINQSTTLEKAVDMEMNFNYAGGEIALKNDLILEIKKENPSLSLNGKFKLKIIIYADSTIKVVSILNVKDDCKACAQKIEKALYALKKWIPEVKNANSISSKKEFTLDF